MKVGSLSDVFISVPQEDADKLKSQYVLTNPQVEAPLKKGLELGNINIVDNGKVIKTVPLVAFEDVAEGEIISRAIDYVKLKI